MIRIESRVGLNDVAAREITDFLLDCDDARYQAWWPGTHRQFHVVKHGDGHDHVGDVVWMDEFVGTRHLRMGAEVVSVVPGAWVIWRMRLGRLPLPVHLTVQLDSGDHGLCLRHVVTAGWSGSGRLLDPMWRLFFTSGFAHDMDRHARTEFPRLATLLRTRTLVPPEGS